MRRLMLLLAVAALALAAVAPASADRSANVRSGPHTVQLPFGGAPLGPPGQVFCNASVDVPPQTSQYVCGWMYWFQARYSSSPLPGAACQTVGFLPNGSHDYYCGTAVNRVAYSVSSNYYQRPWVGNTTNFWRHFDLQVTN